MNESNTGTTRFTVEAPTTRTGMPSRARVMRARLKRADAHPIDYSNMPELADEWFLRAAREGNLTTPPAKKPNSIRLDEDVLDHFKKEGSRYRTHINAVLWAYMQAQRIVQSR